MPINLSIEYPKLQDKVILLQTDVLSLLTENRMLIEALQYARDTLVLCTLIDKSNTADKSLKVVESALKKVKGK